MRNTLLVLAALIAVFLGLFVASVVVPRPMSEDEASKLGFYQFEEPRTISEFNMTNHLGEPVSDLKGGWSLVFFGFTTCPDICPTTLSVLADAVEQIEKPLQIVMVSVDPDRDTPERLSQYVPAFNPEFVGYTGSFDETVKLAEQLNVAFGKVPGDLPGTYLVDHTASLVLVDAEGRYAGFIKAPHNAGNIARIVNRL